MRRREFTAALASAAAAWPLIGSAQQPEVMRRVGVLSTFGESDLEATAWLKAFEDELTRLGWEQGRSVRIESRLSGNDTRRLQTAAAEVVAMKSDIILAVTTPALAALSRETKTIPIVFVQVADPVRLGFVTSLARSGGNITGFVTHEFQIGGKWLGLLRDSAPGTTRVALLFDPDNPS
jgi:putative ABC transport system substrate-binding protein